MQVELAVDKAIETLLRLGLAVINKDNKVVDGQIVVQAVPCTRAYIILRNRWNTLIN